MPVLKRLGTHLAELKEIHGVNERVERLLAKDTKQPDPILFELLVALLWKINGFDSVEFLDESPNKRTPDLRASNGVDEWFIECKRLDKHSQYIRKERAKWRAMWSLLSDRLVRGGHSIVFDIRFHVELSTLPDDYLAAQLPGKLNLVQPPTHLVSSDTLDVSVSPMDYVVANRHLARYWVRCPSDQLDELIGGKRDPNRGFSVVVAGEFEEFAEPLSSITCPLPQAPSGTAMHPPPSSLKPATSEVDSRTPLVSCQTTARASSTSG